MTAVSAQQRWTSVSGVPSSVFPALATNSALRHVVATCVMRYNVPLQDIVHSRTHYRSCIMPWRPQGMPILQYQQYYARYWLQCGGRQLLKECFEWGQNLWHSAGVGQDSRSVGLGQGNVMWSWQRSMNVTKQNNRVPLHISVVITSNNGLPGAQDTRV